MHIEHETGELMAALGEEMRIPLEVLESDLQLLRTPSQVVTSLDAVRHSMERQVRHLTRVCDDLFDAGRIANGEFHLHREYVALNQVLLDACDDTGRFFRHYDQEMTLNTPDRTLGVEGDASRLLQVFVTLLHLAAKVTPRNGRIRVVLERQAGRAVVGIRCLDDETGNQPQGYSVESDARLEANNQVQQPEPSSESGFGVSLKLVKRIIELHDGMVTIERNGVGHGVEFTVSLTLAGESLRHTPTEVSVLQECIHGPPPWANDRSLAEAEQKDLLAWIAGGKPEGNRQDAPQPLKFDEGWLIGKPDAIFEFAKPVPIKATGVMPYQNIIVETNLSEDKWVQAIEVQPGDRGVVHHVLVFVQDSGEDEGEPVDDAAAERGGFWGIYVPGNSTLVYPEGFAKRIPKGATLKFQMHYTPNGTATTDQTRIGLIWAKEPPKHEVRVAGIVNARLSIPPGADNHREEATLRLPMDATIMGFLPHLHLRGKACKYEVTRSDGQTTTLLDIPRYDFNWQLLYRYFEPLSLKAGDALRFTAWFDNSDKNPANPDPTKTVRWGAQTFDEMHLGYVEYYIPNAKPGESTSLYGGRRGVAGGSRPGFDLEAIFKRLDRNNDGKLIGDEIPEAQRDNLMRLDANKDGAITLEEAKRLRR